MSDANTEIPKSLLKKMDRRTFIKIAAAFGAAAAAGVAVSYAMSSSAKGRIVIIGGGCAGISMAARLKRMLRQPNITIIDPSTLHYYQPGFTLIASGVYDKDEVYRNQSDCIPSGTNWIKDSVVAVDPDKGRVYTANQALSLGLGCEDYTAPDEPEDKPQEPAVDLTEVLAALGRIENAQTEQGKQLATLLDKLSAAGAAMM